jgi:hypothetical protein
MNVPTWRFLCGLERAHLKVPGRLSEPLDFSKETIFPIRLSRIAFDCTFSTTNLEHLNKIKDLRNSLSSQIPLFNGQALVPLLSSLNLLVVLDAAMLNLVVCLGTMTFTKRTREHVKKGEHFWEGSERMLRASTTEKLSIFRSCDGKYQMISTG